MYSCSWWSRFFGLFHTSTTGYCKHSLLIISAWSHSESWLLDHVTKALQKLVHWFNIFNRFIAVTYLFPPPFPLHRPDGVTRVLSWSTHRTYDQLLCAAVNIQGAAVPTTQRASGFCTAPRSFLWTSQGLLGFSWMPIRLPPAGIKTLCVPHQVDQSCVFDQLWFGWKPMATFRTFAARVALLSMTPAVLDAAHAEVVPTWDSHRIPENLSADRTAEAVQPHRDSRLCHVCVEKDGKSQSRFQVFLKFFESVCVCVRGVTKTFEFFHSEATMLVWSRFRNALKGVFYAANIPNKTQCLHTSDVYHFFMCLLRFIWIFKVHSSALYVEQEAAEAGGGGAQNMWPKKERVGCLERKNSVPQTFYSSSS